LEVLLKNLKTKPKHWLDFILWPLLKLFWEPFSVKNSHFWHWVDFDKNLIHKDIFFSVEGSIESKPRKKFLSNLWQTNFGWKKALILEPETDGEYWLGFFELSTGKCQLCSVVLEGKVGILVGHNEVYFFALNSDRKSIYLKKSEETTKNNPLLHTIPLI